MTYLKNTIPDKNCQVKNELHLKPGDHFSPYQTFIGSFIPNCIMKYSKLTATAKLLWARLAQYMGDSGGCYPSHTTLAREVGTTAKSINNALNLLEKEKFIERVKPDAREKGQHKTTEYYFLWHEIFINAELHPSKIGVITNDRPTEKNTVGSNSSKDGTSKRPTEKNTVGKTEKGNGDLQKNLHEPTVKFTHKENHLREEDFKEEEEEGKIILNYFGQKIKKPFKPIPENLKPIRKLLDAGYSPNLIARGINKRIANGDHEEYNTPKGFFLFNVFQNILSEIEGKLQEQSKHEELQRKREPFLKYDETWDDPEAIKSITLDTIPDEEKQLFPHFYDDNGGPTTPLERAQYESISKLRSCCPKGFYQLVIQNKVNRLFPNRLKTKLKSVPEYHKLVGELDSIKEQSNELIEQGTYSKRKEEAERKLKECREKYRKRLEDDPANGFGELLKSVLGEAS